MSLPPGARDVRPVGGGDINDAFRVVLGDGREAFVKTRADVPAGEYAAEAEGLRWLGEPGALRTPEVLVVDEAYLALEWIEPGTLSQAGAEELGRGLAETHAAGAPCFGKEGLGATSRFGWLRLSNEPAEDWARFYAERRLAPLTRMCTERQLLSGSAVGALERLCERLPALLGPAEPAARLHGDLWSGNLIADREGRPWLIDPAAYGAHREVDLAMLRLFGAPSQRIFSAYEEHSPLAEGWQDRVELYQLQALLVHALLFGGSYVGSVQHIAKRFGG